jgi:arginine deiminase
VLFSSAPLRTPHNNNNNNSPIPFSASLYERPVNLDAAKKAHADFRRVMREAGVKVQEGRKRDAGG